ncbi:MAG: hypothetical protein QOH30_1700 [Baekduia sp.]|jgi:hypothetical protein|nr:hypothetical protein [Conexibacter sp.]MDX6715142.1 hypothetical protein [Baekduia sp.]MDX6731387.1 hypothetical protein [Baekduia sp.]
MVYLVIALSFALAGGFVGRLKGSSFFLWALISGVVPFIGLAAALLYRFDTDEPRRGCPNCGHVCMLHDAVCTRCGSELDFPDESEILPPVAPA